MNNDNEALWQAVNELREFRTEHVEKHAALDGRVNTVAAVLGDLKSSVDTSRAERNAQYAEITATLADISKEVTEERGARKFRAQMISWALAIAGLLGIGSWFHSGGSK